jgi:agmatinase
MKITRNDHAFTSRDLKGTNLEPTYSGALSFMRRKYSKELADVDVVVSGFPLDTATTNRPGARFGPRAIRAASSNNAWNRPYGAEFDPFDRLAVIDYGDCHWDHGRPEEIPAAIEAHAAHVLQSGASLLALGGDHFISYPLLRAYAKRHGPLSLIHFDAHSDTWNDAEGAGRVDHGTMFYHAAKDGLVDPRRSVQIGLRTHNDDLMGFNVLDAPWVHENGGAKTAAEVRRIVGGHEAYLTFDIDCLDPSFAPGTGTPVPGGLSSAQAIAILRGLAGIRFVGMDIVEVAPAYDVSEITALTAAHLAHEWLALYALGGKGRD